MASSTLFVVLQLFAILCSLRAAPSSTAVTSTQTTNAGYHVIYSYPGATPPAGLTTSIKAGKVGGVLIFGENVSSKLPSYVEAWQAAYRQSAAYAGVPLLIMTDQEGGEVKRLPGGPSQSEKAVGASSNPSSSATTAGQQAAQALQAYGNNLNLAPVGGVFRASGDFLDRYERSYSNDSSVAAKCVSAFVKAQQAAGVLATVKHFPGLGAAKTNENTDAEPVTISLSAKQLRLVDEEPFRAAIEANVDLFMPSWALYPSVDATYPAGLSKTWIRDELRSRLGFGGVVITDAIEAGGLRAFGNDDGHRAVLALQAGQDLILAGARNVTQGDLVVDAIVKASTDGTLDASDFSQSTQRILSLRKKVM